MVYPKATAFRQGEAGALNRRDVSAVELGGSGLDDQVLHAESIQRAD